MLRGMTEGEHVEGGGSRAVQHLEAWDHFLLGCWAQLTTRID